MPGQTEWTMFGMWDVVFGMWDVIDACDLQLIRFTAGEAWTRLWQQRRTENIQDYTSCYNIQEYYLRSMSCCPVRGYQVRGMSRY